ncbi:MAG: PAS domain S-box protein [Nitrosomonadales bacterium]
MLNDTSPVAPTRFSAQMVAAAVLVNLAMIFLVGLILLQSHQQYQSSAEKMTQSLAHILEESFAGTIAKIDVSMLSVVDEVNRQYGSGGINPAALNAFLAKRLARLPEIDSLRIANEAGIVTYGSGVLPGSNVDINDRKHFIYFKSQNVEQLFVSEPIFARINKKWVLPIARRLNHPDGSFAGVVYALISLEQISASFSHLDVGAHGIVNLRDAGMNIIVRYPEPASTQASIGKNTMSPPLKALLDAGLAAGTYRVPGILDRVERTYSYRKVSQHPLYITVGFSADDYLAPWRNSSLKLVGLSIVFLVISIFLIGMLYRGERRRRQAVQDLQILNRDFITLLESTTDFIYFKGRDSRIRFCSQTLARITGHTSWREMIGKHDLEIFPEDVAQIYYKEELPLFRTGTPIINRIDPYYDAEGRPGWVSTNKWPVFADDGKTVTGIFGISRDISDFKRSEDSLRLSEARYRATFDHAAVGIAQVATDGLFIQINRVFCDIIGYTQAEVLSQHFSFGQITYPEDLAADMAQVQHLLQGTADHYEMEKRYIRKDGELVWVYLSVALLRDTDGIALYFISSVVDITQRKLAEARLLESETHLRTVIENEPECIKIVDEQGLLTQMNPAGLKMIEADTLAQVAGRPVIGVIAPEYREAFIHMHQRVIAGDAMQLKFEVLGLKGGRRLLETHAVPMEEHGKRVHLAVTRDITERQQIEDALNRSNADLERFAYSVSHDMRQPLRAVSGHLQLLQHSLKDRLDEDDRLNMNFALDGAKRMDSMIVSLLDYSRVGRKTEAKQQIESRAAFDEALSFLTPMIAESAAQVKFNGVWPLLFASRDELTRLFQNLIGNAIKFCESGQVPRIEIDSAVANKVWRVSVKDHGVGIDPKQADRLFQFFSRLQSRTRFEGTGMGLALCRRIVEHHDGRIWAESAGEGTGSTFIFELPVVNSDH